MLFFVGCDSDGNGGGKGSSGDDQGIWLTYDGVTYPMTMSVKTVNTRISDTEFWTTAIASGFGKDAVFDENTTEQEFFEGTYLGTLRFYMDIQEDGRIGSAPYSLVDSNSAPGEVTMQISGGVGDIPKDLQSVSGSLTVDSIAYEDGELFGDEDTVLELTSDAKLKSIQINFDGVFRGRTKPEGEEYAISGKVIYQDD